MPIDERRNADALQTRDQLGLADVDDDEIGLQRQDALEVRVQQRADARPLRGLGRIRVEARHADDLIAGADREEHLGDRGDEADDSRRPRPVVRCGAEHDAPSAASTQAASPTRRKLSPKPLVSSSSQE